MRKKIAVITTTRADYGYLRSVMRAIREREDSELIPIAIGSHIFKDNATYELVKEENPELEECKVKEPNGTPLDNARFFAEMAKKSAPLLNRINPDFAVVLGDRIEMFGVALSAVFQNIAIAHIHGGDRAGPAHDERIRNALAKIVDVHFPALPSSAERLISMGEEPSRIHMVGSPTIDDLLSTKHLPIKDLLKKYNLKKDYVLVIQHPLTATKRYSDGKRQIEETIEGVKLSGLDFLVVMPNQDIGSREITKRLEEYYENERIKTIYGLNRDDYVGLLKFCKTLVGNSSSGIIEAASFKIPVVNIGPRQGQRDRSGNVIDVPYERDRINNSIKYVCDNADFKRKLSEVKNIYGDGQSGKRIAEILALLDNKNPNFLHKVNTY